MHQKVVEPGYLLQQQILKEMTYESLWSVTVGESGNSFEANSEYQAKSHRTLYSWDSWFLNFIEEQINGGVNGKFFDVTPRC